MAIWRTAARIEHSILGGTGTNTWTCRQPAIGAGDPGVDADLEDITDWIEAFYSAVTGVLAAGTVVTLPGEWLKLDDEPTMASIPERSVTAAGGSGVLPPSQCMVVSWKTSSPTRGGRGRTFVGPLMLSTCQEDGTPTPAALAIVRDAAAALVESSDSFLDGGLGVYSRAGVSNPEDPGIFRDFTSATTANKFAVLRSRRD